MNAKETLGELERLGTAQNRKVYARHGVGPKMYGVSFANLRALAKKIKVDHGLAIELWASGNHDARILATMIADPERLDRKTLESWARDLDNYVVTDMFSALASRAPAALAIAEKWMRSRGEWTGSAGWTVLGLIADDADGISDEALAAHLETIEREIHGRKNRVRYAMNQALINIGVRNPALQKKAVAAAKRVGTVEVDHGETGCKTPDAASYIEKTVAHRKKKGK